MIKKGRSVERLWLRNGKICTFCLIGILTGLKPVFHVLRFEEKINKVFYFQKLCLKDKQGLEGL